MTDATRGNDRSRAARAKALRRFVRRVLKDYRAGRDADSCMEEINRRFAQEWRDEGRARP